MAFWDKIGSVGNVEDRRGLSSGLLGGSGLVGIIIVVAMTFLGGGDPTQILGQLLGQVQSSVVSNQSGEQAPEFRGEDDYEVFASRVLGSANDTWREAFSASGDTYREPKLVLFRDITQSSCGVATAQVGPHYCPADETIYLDETFFDELTSRLGAEGGDVAEAYVIAHEVGHHVQNIAGIMNQTQLQDSGSESSSVKLELQADCFAGVWAYSIADLGVFEQGEINEAIDAAAAVGDDRIQQKTQGQVNQESWTHGSSAQRVQWFERGYNTGKPSSCNTFG